MSLPRTECKRPLILLPVKWKHIRPRGGLGCVCMFFFFFQHTHPFESIFFRSCSFNPRASTLHPPSLNRLRNIESHISLCAKPPWKMEQITFLFLCTFFILVGGQALERLEMGRGRRYGCSLTFKLNV